MAYPTVPVNTTNVDVSTDSPATARSDILDGHQKLNQMIAHTSTFAATLLDDANAATARATLGAAASGANADITSLVGIISGLGYASGVGAGGVVTQLTSKSTDVTLNKFTGRINMAADTMTGPNDYRNFVCYCTGVLPDDLIIANVVYSGLFGDYFVSASAGIDLIRFTLQLRASATKAEAVGISYAVLRGAKT